MLKKKQPLFFNNFTEDDMRALFREEVKPRLAKFAEVGHYNQEI